jgi:hypothetical protein
MYKRKFKIEIISTQDSRPIIPITYLCQPLSTLALNITFEDGGNTEI